LCHRRTGGGARGAGDFRGQRSPGITERCAQHRLDAATAASERVTRCHSRSSIAARTERWRLPTIATWPSTASPMARAFRRRGSLSDTGATLGDTRQVGSANGRLDMLTWRFVTLGWRILSIMTWSGPVCRHRVLEAVYRMPNSTGIMEVTCGLVRAR
jgi:hypothetical protein